LNPRNGTHPLAAARPRTERRALIKLIPIEVLILIAKAAAG
jgi:hypothetical protein